jgi:hypothetical protein
LPGGVARWRCQGGQAAVSEDAVLSDISAPGEPAGGSPAGASPAGGLAAFTTGATFATSTACRCVSAGRLGRGVDPGGEACGVAGVDVTGHRGHLQFSAVIAEDVVGLERDIRHVVGGTLVGVQLVDHGGDILRNRKLRSGDGVLGVGDRVDVGVDLEVNVRPASRVARRHDRGESHFSVRRRRPGRRAARCRPRLPRSTWSTRPSALQCQA